MDIVSHKTGNEGRFVDEPDAKLDDCCGEGSVVVGRGRGFRSRRWSVGQQMSLLAAARVQSPLNGEGPVPREGEGSAAWERAGQGAEQLVSRWSARADEKGAENGGCATGFGRWGV